MQHFFHVIFIVIPDYLIQIILFRTDKNWNYRNIFILTVKINLYYYQKGEKNFCQEKYLA